MRPLLVGIGLWCLASAAVAAPDEDTPSPDTATAEVPVDGPVSDDSSTPPFAESPRMEADGEAFWPTALRPCRTLLAEAALDDAKVCLQVRGVDANVPISTREAAIALIAHLDTLAVESPSVAESPSTATRLLSGGAPELLISSTLYGGVAGFLLAAGGTSLFRLDRAPSSPFLLATPALGALTGGALAAAFSLWREPDAGQVALTSSLAWLGTGATFLLHVPLFDRIDPVQGSAWRFATVLGGGVVPAAAGLVFSQFVDVDPGDVAFANSVAVTSLAVAALATMAGASTLALTPIGRFVVVPPPPRLDEPLTLRAWDLMVPIVAATVIPYGLTLLAAPLLDVPRAATWLIEVGALAGLLGATSLALTMAATTPILFGVWPIAGAYVSSAALWTFPLGVATGAALGATGAILLGRRTTTALVPSLPDGVSAQFFPLIGPAQQAGGSATLGAGLGGQF